MTRRFIKGLGIAGSIVACGALGFGVAAWASGDKPKLAKLIKVSAHRYEFVPKELTLKKGEPVDIELSTLDVVMGFNMPDFQMRESIVPGQVAHVRFTPSKVGTFTFLCDIFCGSGHEDMNGTIIVTE